MTWLNLLMNSGSRSTRLRISCRLRSLRLPRIEKPHFTAIRCAPRQIKTQTSPQLMMCVKPWFDSSAVAINLLDHDFLR